MTSHAGAAALAAGSSFPLLTENGFPLLTESGGQLLTERGGSGGAALTAGAALGTGAASLSGAGALSAAGGVPGLGAAVLSGTGTAHGSGGATFSGAGSAPLSGSGSLGPDGPRVPGGLGAFLFALPSLTPSARVIKLAAASWSAGTLMTASGFVPVLMARPVMAAAALVLHPGAAALHAAGSLTAVTSSSAAHLAAAPALLAPGQMATARLLAGTSLVVSGQYFMPGQASLSAAAHLTAAAKVTEPAAAPLSAPAAMAASALLRVPAAAALSAPGHVTAAASSSSAHLAAAGALSAAGSGSSLAAAALHAPGSVTAAARVREHASAALSATAALAPRGTVTRPAGASLRATAALRAAGTRIVPAHASLSSGAALSAAGSRTAVAHAALAAEAVLHPAGLTSPGARMHAVPSLASAGKVSRVGAAALSSAASLAATAHGVTFPKAAWQAPGTLLPTPLGVVRASAALSARPGARVTAVTAPGTPFPRRPSGQQPAWQRDVQRFAVVQERQRHAQALWQYGELVVACLMWRPQDIDAGLARRCTRCYFPSATLDVLPPDTPAPAGWPTPAVESQISSAYGQGSQFRCTLCYGTQVIAAGSAEVPGVRALLVRPAIITDTDQDQQRSAKGVLGTGSVQVQTTPDFRVSTLDYLFRSDGRRYQLQVPARTTLRTGFGSPWQASAAVSYNLASASLEDPRASVAYVIPPPGRELSRVLGTYTRVPADYAWFEQVNGPLIPEEDPPPAASGEYQPPAVLGA